MFYILFDKWIVLFINFLNIKIIKRNIIGPTPTEISRVLKKILEKCQVLASLLIKMEIKKQGS